MKTCLVEKLFGLGRIERIGFHVARIETRQKRADRRRRNDAVTIPDAIQHALPVDRMGDSLPNLEILEIGIVEIEFDLNLFRTIAIAIRAQGEVRQGRKPLNCR